MSKLSAEQIAQKILEWKRLPEKDLKRILSSSDLYTDGFFDSLLNMKLLFELEKALGKKISPFHVIKKNFISISAILALQDRLEKESP